MEGKKPFHLKSKSREFTPILPKPVQDLNSQPSESQSQLIYGPCSIGICAKPSCNLRSHHHYIHGRHSTSKRDLRTQLISRTHTTNKLNASKPRIQKTIAKAAGFPVLPLNKTEAADFGINHFFHDFFVRLLDRIFSIVVPPFDGYRQWAQSRRHELFQYGTSAKLDCLNFIGAAYIATLGRSRLATIATDPCGIRLHGRIISQLRETLKTFEPLRDADNVINVIYTLAIFDLAANLNKEPSPLLLHRSALIRIIEGCGGLHKSGTAMVLAVSLDRLIAIVTETSPLYMPWEHIKIPIQRVPLYPAIYGEQLSLGCNNDLIDNDVRSYCIEVCRAIEILEGENWNFDGRTRNEPSGEVYYFYYLRDRVAAQFAHLNARYAKQNSRIHCVLLTAKLVEYLALTDNYNAPLSVVLANRLMQILEEQDLQLVWAGNENIIRWILLVIICMPDQWHGNDEMYERYHKTLHTFDNIGIPTDWQMEYRYIVTSFVWSWTRLGDTFESASRYALSREVLE